MVQMFGLLLILPLPCSHSHPGRDVVFSGGSPADSQTSLAEHEMGTSRMRVAQVLAMSVPLGGGKVGS